MENAESHVVAADWPRVCPRCATPTPDQEFYGLCDVCSTSLRSTFADVDRDVADVEYEPKMNVTPNAVALKE